MHPPRRPLLPPDWPNAAASRQISCRPYLWHVQEMGQGPLLLLLHGAGAATHSWRSLMPLLARHYRVIAPDLPGHGFTRLRSRSRTGLNPMAEDIARLCADKGWQPAALVGHSAGGAIALRLAQTLPTPPQALVCINPALENFQGVAGWLFPALAKMLALAPIVPLLFSRMAGREARVRELLTSTGSALDDDGLSQYLTLIRDPGHVDGALAMMAQWRLDELLASLPGITQPTLFITGARDKAVPPDVARRAASGMTAAEFTEMERYGHLVHEEAPAEVAALIEAFLARILAR